jgi:ERCC4-related helicase
MAVVHDMRHIISTVVAMSVVASRIQHSWLACRRSFIGQGSGGKNSGGGMSQKEQKEVLEGFRCG